MMTGMLQYPHGFEPPSPLYQRGHRNDARRATVVARDGVTFFFWYRGDEASARAHPSARRSCEARAAFFHNAAVFKPPLVCLGR